MGVLIWLQLWEPEDVNILTAFFPPSTVSSFILQVPRSLL